MYKEMMMYVTKYNSNSTETRYNCLQSKNIYNTNACELKT